MPIMECLGKMGFSADEAQAIIDDVGDGKASEVVRQHIKLLEQERESIIKQATPNEAGATTASSYSGEALAQANPSMQIASEKGPVAAADALAHADAEITSAKQEAPGFDAAVACALRG